MVLNRNRILALTTVLSAAIFLGLLLGGTLAGADGERDETLLAQSGGHETCHDHPDAALLVAQTGGEHGEAGAHDPHAEAEDHGDEAHAGETHGHGEADHGEEAHGAASHGEHGEEEHAEPEGAPHLANLITLIVTYFGQGEGEHGMAPWAAFLHRFENVFFAWLAAGILCVVVHVVYRRRSMIPGRLQGGLEIAVEGLDGLVCGVLGKKDGRKRVAFLGSLFLYILIMNLMGLVPFLHSSSSCLDITAGLAICVFLYVQYSGIRNLGFLGYLDHLAGNPRDAVTWCLVPIMIPLHIIGELAKPLSLSLRLFGNITGEDILIAVFVGLGAASLHFTGLPLGIPVQVPLIFLAILTSFIQALVFTLLSTVYFLLMQHHEEEAH